ncbi:hypothetical protein PGO_060980 [Plasmodium gonderi]|uniref:ATP synthase mitochondrial F1 complex assembly factor 2 n=1 Tax=Plasmodium gonderi TaxID=77519 RepID=A0A1Y1JIN8_PLAGO|nr:hypothetical protein PGO_060980 [Plasmodium gonderi]GAW79954.1 hypothetical protein PGO_060980 [Plasmodium gonderi]
MKIILKRGRNPFHVFKRCRSSTEGRPNCGHICLNDDKQNLKRFANLEKIHLKKNACTKKVEIFIDDLILLTKRKNVFSFYSFDLCFLIKLEILRNKEKMNLRKMPITLSSNNMIDFVNLVHACEEVAFEEYSPMEKKIFLKETQLNDTHAVNRCKYDNVGVEVVEEHCYENKEKIQRKEGTMKPHEMQRDLIENKLYENFKNDLIFYHTGDLMNSLDKVKKEDLTEKIDLPMSLNYIENYKILNLREEENNVYNKYIHLFEDMHNVKLIKAKHFETPEQDYHVQKKIKNIIKNMNNSELFLFYKCTQILNSFVFTYLFLNGHMDYKEAYRYSNLDYIYQFLKWGYVYDVNIYKDASALLTLSSLRLIRAVL